MASEAHWKEVMSEATRHAYHVQYMHALPTCIHFLTMSVYPAVRETSVKQREIKGGGPDIYGGRHLCGMYFFGNSCTYTHA